MDAINKDTLKHYFSDIMTEFDLRSKLSQTYNVDESGIPFDLSAPNVTMKGTEKVWYWQSGKWQVTVVGCSSTSGHALPPPPPQWLYLKQNILILHVLKANSLLVLVTADGKLQIYLKCGAVSILSNMQCQHGHYYCC